MPSIAEQAERSHVSTGHLLEPETVKKLVSHAHRRFKSNTDGQNSQVYPALAGVPSDLFGVGVVGTGGRAHAAGDIESELSMMSVSKPTCVWISFGSHGVRGVSAEHDQLNRPTRGRLQRPFQPLRPDLPSATTLT